MSAEARVAVLTVPGCHLCDQAIAAVAGVCAETGVEWREQNLLDLDEDAVRRWRDLVPVVLVDGEVVGELRVDPQRLRAALGS